MSHRSTQLRQDRDRQVEIRLHRGRVCVHPVPRGLRAALRIQEIRFEGSQPQAGNFDLEPFVISSDTLTIAPGLLSRAMGWLEKRHYHCHVEDQRNVDPLDPQPTAVIDAGNDPDLLSVLQNHTHGTLIVSGRREAIDKVVDVCRCLPKATIGIVTANKHLARHLAFELCGRVREHVDCQPGTDAWYTTRIRVVPANHLPAFHGQQVEILIILFDHDAISQKAMERLSDLRPTPWRVYALRRKGRFSEAEIIALETIAGPVIHTSPKVRQIKRQYCRSRSFPDLNPARDLESKQRIWQHKGRNRWIAEIAGACRDGDRETLWQHGLFLGEGERPPESPAVCVLVESRTHAAELNRYLES